MKTIQPGYKYVTRAIQNLYTCYTRVISDTVEDISRPYLITKVHWIYVNKNATLVRRVVS